MKIVKGVFVYTMLLIGIALIFGMLVLGSMFFLDVPVFGWKALYQSHKITADIYSEKITGSEIDLTINAGMYDVNISQYVLRQVDEENDATKKIEYIGIDKMDDLWGLYKRDDQKKSVSENGIVFNKVSDSKMIIDVEQVEGLISPRKSYINVRLPYDKEYNLTINTTKGDIYINGSGDEDVSNLKINSLKIKTDSGNFGWKNVKTTILAKPNLRQDQTHEIDDEGNVGNPLSEEEVDKQKLINMLNCSVVEKVGDTPSVAEEFLETIKVQTYSYISLLPLNELVAETNTGKLNFSLSTSGTEFTAITPVYSAIKGSTKYRLADDKVGERKGILNGGLVVYAPLKRELNNDDKTALSNWVNAVERTQETTFRFYANRGEITFSNIYALGGLNLEFGGNDILLKADEIDLGGDFFLNNEGLKLLEINKKINDNFNFNVPYGFFEIGKLKSSLITIVADNIDIKLAEVNGELSIKTTYGNISVDKNTNNATLKSTHGDIVVGDASASLSAVSEHGNITVKYRDRVYLKNKHGKINATFVKTEGAQYEDTGYTAKSTMINEAGSINAENICFATTFQSLKGGTVNVNFAELHESLTAENAVEHNIIMASGTANITVPFVEFRVKGKGVINGNVGTISVAEKVNAVTDGGYALIASTTTGKDDCLAKINLGNTGTYNFSSSYGA